MKTHDHRRHLDTCPAEDVRAHAQRQPERGYRGERKEALVKEGLKGWNTGDEGRGQPLSSSTEMTEGDAASSCHYASRKRGPRPLQAEVSLPPCQFRHTMKMNEPQGQASGLAPWGDQDATFF